MKNWFLLSFTIILSACQSTKIDDITYKISKSSTKLGSIGQASKSNIVKNNFETKAFPILKTKIRVQIEIFPFDKNKYDIYLSKMKFVQQVQKIQYIDSLPEKPEYITITILDSKGYINEINADYNKENVTYLKNIKKARVVTAVSTVPDKEIIAKINQADAFYLVNKLDKKYTLELYEQGKLTDTIDIESQVLLGYTLKQFCWAENEKFQLYIGDIINENESCSSIKKKQINLFKL